jgi:hypothetical protein
MCCSLYLPSAEPQIEYCYLSRVGGKGISPDNWKPQQEEYISRLKNVFYEIMYTCIDVY